MRNPSPPCDEWLPCGCAAVGTPSTCGLRLDTSAPGRVGVVNRQNRGLGESAGEPDSPDCSFCLRFSGRRLTLTISPAACPAPSRRKELGPPWTYLFGCLMYGTITLVCRCTPCGRSSESPIPQNRRRPTDRSTRKARRKPRRSMSCTERSSAASSSGAILRRGATESLTTGRG